MEIKRLDSHGFDIRIGKIQIWGTATIDWECPFYNYGFIVVCWDGDTILDMGKQ